MFELAHFAPSDRERLCWIGRLDDLLGGSAVQFRQPDGIVVITKSALDEFLYEAADEVVSELEVERNDGGLAHAWKGIVKRTAREGTDLVLDVVSDLTRRRIRVTDGRPTRKQASEKDN